MKRYLTTGLLAVLFFAAIGLLQGSRAPLIVENAYSLSLTSDSPVVIYGDSRSGHQVHQKIIDAILQLHPKAVFHTGDLVFNGKSDAQWSVFNSIVADLLKVAPIYPAIGNHELGTLSIQQELQLPNNGEWYSVDVDSIHFILLDVVADYGPESEQYKWLIKDLESQPQGTAFTAVITHYPFYSTGSRQTDTAKLHSILIPVFEKYGVDIVFSGHHHCYERCYAGGIYYITTAGGGAPLYPQKKTQDFSQLYIKNYHFCTLDQRADSLIVTALDTNLLTIDRFIVFK